MKIKYGKSNWEVAHLPIIKFLELVKEDGFDAAEIYLDGVSEKPEQIINSLKEYEIDLIAQIATQGETVEDHMVSMEKRFKFAASCKPVFINSHTGRDIFSFEDNLKLYKHALELSKEYCINIIHETHRGRPTYSLLETEKYLRSFPELRLNADISHWMVVHESDLSDQKERLDFAISRADYIHARVGYAEGPQIPHPNAPKWKATVDNHISIWQKFVDNKKGKANTIYITPEFGPPDYMHTVPFQNKAVADTWEVNVEMKSILEKRLKL